MNHKHGLTTELTSRRTLSGYDDTRALKINIGFCSRSHTITKRVFERDKEDLEPPSRLFIRQIRRIQMHEWRPELETRLPLEDEEKSSWQTSESLSLDRFQGLQMQVRSASTERCRCHCSPGRTSICTVLIYLPGFIVDEAPKPKSIATVAHRSASDLRARHHVLLTATPIINRPIDLVGLLALVWQEE